MAPATLYKVYYPAREAAGRKDLRWHDLRHTGAVLAAQTGATLAELMGRLGPTTPGAAMRCQHAAAKPSNQLIPFGITGYSHRMAMTLRLTEAEDRALTEQAAREHRSKQEVARAAIVEYTSRRTRTRDDLLAKIGRENAGALERLADS